MPSLAAKPCRHAGCRALVRDGGGYCAAHKRVWVKPPTATKRITGRRLQAMREALFRRSPLCVECLKQGKYVKATQRDHVIPLAEGGLDDESNEQALCDDCHDIKSKAESRRGRDRAR